MFAVMRRKPTEDVDLLDSGQAGAVFIVGGGLRGIAYTGAVIASIAATPLLTRHLHAVAYGRYVMVTSLLAIVAALTEGGLANLGVREFSGAGDRERRAFMRNLIGLRIALSLVGSAAAIGFVVVANYSNVIVAGTAIASLGLVLANLQVTLAVPLTASLRLAWLAVLDFTGPALTALALVLLVILGAPLLPFFAAALCGYLVTLAMTAQLVRAEVTLRPAFSVGRWRTLLGESGVFAAATALAVIYVQVVLVAMSLLTNGHQVGIFGLAFRVLSVVNGIPLLLVGSAFPILLRAARDDRARLRYSAQRLFEGAVILGGWLSLLVVSGAPFIVQVLGGGEYNGSVAVLQIVGGGVIATFLAAVWSFLLLSLGMYRRLITINAGMVVLAIALCVGLVPRFGARGAAATTVSLEVVIMAAYGVTLLVTQRDLRPQLARAGRALVALGIAFAVALATPLSGAAAALAGSAALAAGLVAMRALPPELVEIVRRSARS